jgi:hypothetical protein
MLINNFTISFMKICAIMPSLQGIVFKNRNFGGFSQGKEAPKTILGQGVAKAAA